MAKFGICNTTTKNELVHQYCQSMYGSILWSISSPNINRICTQWCKAHFRVLSLPSTTHCDLLPLIADNVSLETRLDCKYLSFYKSIATSDNRLINHVSKSRLHASTSTMGKNVTHLLQKYNLQIENVLTYSKDKIKNHCYQK